MAMVNNFNNKVIHFDKNKSSSFFPERFSNEIYHSSLTEFYSLSYTSNFSIKYVVTGYEKYSLGNTPFRLYKNQYLLVNDGQKVGNNGASGEGISIFINKELIQNGLTSLLNNDAFLLDNPFHIKKENINFYENIFPANDDLGQLLSKVHMQIIGNKNMELTEAFYLEIVTALLKSQIRLTNKIKLLKEIKYSTRAELYRRVLLAKAYIEDHTTASFSLDLLSENCFLSKYHLIRTFKKIHGVTPHQYFIKLRIEKARKMLLEHNNSIGEVAHILGFNDIFSFSKQFKSIVGCTPTMFRLDA